MSAACFAAVFNTPSPHTDDGCQSQSIVFTQKTKLGYHQGRLCSHSPPVCPTIVHSSSLLFPLQLPSILSAHTARASGPLILTHGPERCRPPPAQARSRRQRPRALLCRRGQRGSTLLGATTAVLCWLQDSITGRRGRRQRRSLTADFAPAPVFSCTTAAPAAEATSGASVYWVSQRGIRERNVDFL